MWDKVLGPVADKRTESGTLKLFPVYLKGEDLFGLTVPAVAKITESVCIVFAVLLELNILQFRWVPRHDRVRSNLFFPLSPSFQLPGVEACERYSFRYGRNPLVELPLMLNPAGSARAQPKTSSPYTSLVIR